MSYIVVFQDWTLMRLVRFYKTQHHHKHKKPPAYIQQAVFYVYGHCEKQPGLDRREWFCWVSCIKQCRYKKVYKMENITILGAGTMGHSIALSAAWAGKTVNIYGIDDQDLENADT